MASMFRSPEDISSSSSDSGSEAPIDGDQFPDSKAPLGESPAETIEIGTTVHPTLSSQAEENGSYHEITAGVSPDHGEVLDLDADGHASLMTAALLEFYCKTRALEILNRQTGDKERFKQDSPEVQMLGKRLYEYKSRFLSSHGVIAHGIDGDDWDNARQYYRDSLDTLGSTALETLQLDLSEPPSPNNGVVANSANSTKAISRRLPGKRPQRRITDREAVNPVLEPPPNFTSLLHLPPPATSSIPLLSPPSHQMTRQSSRYAAEFTEIKLIGKGSFGSVYHVNNHVDGQSYAVKKIPISGKRLRQFQDGLKDLENLLKEIRTLARLDHLNIVRYFGAWVEQSESSADPNNGDSRNQLQRPLLSQDPATGEELGGGMVFEESSHGIVFENSSIPASVAGGLERGSTHSTIPSSRTRKTPSAENEVDDEEDVESIPRQFSIPSQDPTSTVSGTDQDIFTDDMGENMSNMQIGQRNQRNTNDPVMTLHIQMSLHPISLATYLSPLTQSGLGNRKQDSPRHCFHVVPSLKLILGILSGVEYLHAKGIVHRDLKPGNIFLSPCDITTHVCPRCENTTPDVPQYTIPRIGDFGLVAEISEYGEQDQSSVRTPPHLNKRSPAHEKRVGTEFYRPPVFKPSPRNGGDEKEEQGNSNVQTGFKSNNQVPRSRSASYINEKLDVFALGVILFELLYKLDTRMERQLVLFDLTRAPSTKSENSSFTETNFGATLPADFRTRLDSSFASMSSSLLDSLTSCIKGMLDSDSERRWSCKAVRECLEGVLSAPQGVSS